MANAHRWAKPAAAVRTSENLPLANACKGVLPASDALPVVKNCNLVDPGRSPNDLRQVCRQALDRGWHLFSWFMAGAALLPLDARGRLGVDLPKVRGTYWPHRKNYERLQRSEIDWRLFCQGPIADQPALGLERLRVSIDSLPAPMPAIVGALPAPLVLPLFAMLIPDLIIPYADAASVILAHVQREDSTSRHRVFVALPAGMKGKKDEWVAAPRAAA